jgi:hypothetical protein
MLPIVDSPTEADSRAAELDNWLDAHAAELLRTFLSYLESSAGDAAAEKLLEDAPQLAAMLAGEPPVPEPTPDLPVWLGTPVTCPWCEAVQTHCNLCHFSMYDPPLGGEA